MARMIRIVVHVDGTWRCAAMGDEGAPAFEVMAGTWRRNERGEVKAHDVNVTRRPVTMSTEAESRLVVAAELAAASLVDVELPTGEVR